MPIGVHSVALPSVLQVVSLPILEGKRMLSVCCKRCICLCVCVHFLLKVLYMDSLQHICAFLCVEVVAMATAGENRQPRVKTTADPTISVSELEEALEAFMKKKRKI